MFWLLIALFIVAIVLGMFLLSYILANKNTPKGVAFIHGGVAGIGVIGLLIFSFFSSLNFLISVGIFLLAAMGGVFMMYLDLTGKPLPKWLPLGHGIMGLIGLAVFVGIYFYH